MKLKSKRMHKKGTTESFVLWVLRIAIVAAVIWFIWAQNNSIISNQFIYADPDIPKSLVGYNIVHISDIKNSDLDVSKTVERLNPDIIVLTGGYEDENGNSGSTVSTVNKLSTIAPVYYIYSMDDKTDSLASTSATNITDTNVEIAPEQISAEQFIKKVYGNEILKKASKGDETSIQYINYVTEALSNSNNKINLFGLGNYESEGGQYSARDKAYELILKSNSDYTVSLLGNVYLLDEVCKAEIDMMMFGGTFGTNRLSNTYVKGMYANNGTQLFVSSGIGNNGNMRILNLPCVQSIVLSDGTIKDKNPLERFLGTIFKDVGTIYDNDGGFEEYYYQYGDF